SADPPWEHGPTLPKTFPLIPAIDVTSAQTRIVEFDTVLKDGVTYFGIDGKTGADIPMYHASLGSTEIWKVTNATELDHPFHLHGYAFQVLDVAGVATTVREWRDTVNIPAMKKLTFAVRFDDRPGHWMFHCHILDHADMGMAAMLMVE